ncbi:MAG: YdbC family protein [Oscillospiraceae bacterium]
MVVFGSCTSTSLSPKYYAVYDQIVVADETRIKETSRSTRKIQTRRTEMAEITFEITKNRVISENAKGFTRELNLVSWNEREPKYDIRD